MSRVTRRVPAEAVGDLLAAAPRASLAFPTANGIDAAPVAFRFRAGRYWVGFSVEASLTVPAAGDEAELVIDDGRWFFDLRGLRVRGHLLRPEQSPDGAATWFELSPERVIAWDYATLHPVADDESR